MSSAVVFTSAAQSRPLVFDGKAVPEVSLPEPGEARPPQAVRYAELSSSLASNPKLIDVTQASRLEIRRRSC